MRWETSLLPALRSGWLRRRLNGASLVSVQAGCLGVLAGCSRGKNDCLAVTLRYDLERTFDFIFVLMFRGGFWFVHFQMNSYARA